MGFLIHTTSQILKHFVECKPLISEECLEVYENSANIFERTYFQMTDDNHLNRSAFNNVNDLGPY